MVIDIVRVHAPIRWIFDTITWRRDFSDSEFLINHGISPEHIPIPPVYPPNATILVGPILMNFWAFVMPWHVTVVIVGRSLAVLVLKCCIEIHLLEAYWMLKWRFKILLNQKTCGWVPNDHLIMFFFAFFAGKMVAFCGFFLVGVRQEMTSRRDPSATKSWARRCLGRDFFTALDSASQCHPAIGF
jgi:hypothetical protein